MSANFKFDFSGKKPQKAKAKASVENVAPDAAAEAYRQRAKAEEQRRTHATDSEFWVCICYPTVESLGKWRQATGFGVDHQIYKAADVFDGLEPFRPSKRNPFGGMSFNGGFQKATVTPDPLADVEYTGDLQVDCLREFEVLHAAFMAAAMPVPLVEPTDSDIYIVIAFPDRQAKEAWLGDYGLKKLGDKYLDGAAIMRQLHM